MYSIHTKHLRRIGLSSVFYTISVSTAQRNPLLYQHMIIQVEHTRVVHNNTGLHGRF